MGRYLVTGGAGFIGSALCRALLQVGHDVVVIDDLTTGKLENVPHEVTFLEGSLHELHLLSSLSTDKFDAIIHLAAQSSSEESFNDPVYDLRTNAESTLVLLELAKRIGCWRFIFASSVAVYGKQPDGPISEDALASPESFYGVGKLASEHYLRIYQQFGIKSTSLRFFNIYGPGQDLQNMNQGMVSIYMAQMINDNNIYVKGSPMRYRDLLYIDDLIEAIMITIDCEQAFNTIVNVGTGVRTTVGEIIDVLKNISEENVSVNYSGNTLGDVFGFYANIEKVKGILSWAPKTAASEGIKQMHDWAVRNVNGERRNES